MSSRRSAVASKPTTPANTERVGDCHSYKEKPNTTALNATMGLRGIFTIQLSLQMCFIPLFYTVGAHFSDRIKAATLLKAMLRQTMFCMHFV